MKNYHMKRFYLLLIFFLFPLSSFAGVADLSPVSHWTCDETSGIRYDSNVVNSNDLSDYNSVGYSAGALNNACHFISANSEYLNISDMDQLNLDLVSSRTYSFWVKPAVVPSGGNGYALLYKWSSNNAQYGILYVDSAGPKINFLGYDSCAGSNINHTWSISALSTSVFTHVVVTYDASSKNAELWINGVSQGVVNSGFNGGANCSGYFSLSSLGSGIQWYWDGDLDEITVFNYKLTNGNIATLYNSGTPMSYPSSGGGSGTTTSTTTATSTTTVDMDDTNFLLSIIIFFLSFFSLGFIFSVLKDKK